MAKYNIVQDYDWTSAPRGSYYRKEAPRIWLKSYKIDSNQIMSAIKGYVAIIKGRSNAKKFYDKLYGESTTPEDDFWFPYFDDNVRSFSNTFGDTFQNGIGGGGGIGSSQFDNINQYLGALGQIKDSISGVGDAITQSYNTARNGDFSLAGSQLQQSLSKSGNPGSYIETPMFYQFEKNDSPINVNMIISNTLNEDSLQKNLELITKLTKINRPFRKDSTAVDPPRIYKIRLHGLRYIRWAYCNSFSINLLGSKREIDGIITPEAYGISMSFQSLTMEHAGFLDEAIKP